MDNTAYSDEELVSLSLANKRFFAEIVHRYEEKLSRYINRLGRLDSEDREDLLQEVFLKVYQNLNSFDRDQKFSSWIYRITHNETIAFFRRRNVRPHGHLVDGSEKLLSGLASELNLMQDLEKKDDERILGAVLENLPQQHKEVLILRFFEHKSYDEISDILTIPAGTVATRLNRAKERMKSELDKQDYNI